MTDAVTTSPDPMFAVCGCSHTQRRHLDGDGACDARACMCLAFREKTGRPAPIHADAAALAPRPATPPPAATRPTPANTAPPRATLLERGRASVSLRTRAIAEKIEALYMELRARLQEEDDEAAAADAARVQVSRLEKQLADARSALRQYTRGRPSGPRKFACPEPDCDRAFSTPQGVGGHITKAHGGRS